jgi:hypothetical protein
MCKIAFAPAFNTPIKNEEIMYEKPKIKSPG